MRGGVFGDPLRGGEARAVDEQRGLASGVEARQTQHGLAREQPADHLPTAREQREELGVEGVDLSAQRGDLRVHAANVHREPC